MQAANTTTELLHGIGERLRSCRLRQNKSLDQIAREAGLGRATVVRAEAGENPTMETVVRILRALGMLDALDAFLPEPLVSPLQLAQTGGRERQRASGARRKRG